MTSRIPINPLLLLGGIAFLLCRFLIPVAHFILLIYDLARSSWDTTVSSIDIVILFMVIACFILVFIDPSDERSNLSQARIALASSLIQSAVMTGLLVACMLARLRVYLIVVHSFHLAILYGILCFNSQRYHKLRLAPPNSSLHIPFNALIAGDVDRMRAARPDYTRRSRYGIETKMPRGTGLEATGTAGMDNEAVSGKEPSHAPAAPPSHRLAVTSQGDILVGSGGDDDRRWWEKW